MNQLLMTKLTSWVSANSALNQEIGRQNFILSSAKYLTPTYLVEMEFDSLEFQWIAE